MLTLSRLDELTAPALLESVDLVELTRSCSAELAPQALARNISLELGAESPLRVHASEELLRILLRNLLDNAIRYTPQGEQVVICLSSEENHAATLEIVDSGIGVDEGKLALLGKRFNRLNSSGPEGVGLGLSIVLRIAALHRANVEFRQAAGHSGLAVTVRFPQTS